MKLEQTLEQKINSNPLGTDTELQASDIIFLKLQLEIVTEQILEKYGKFKLKYSEVYKTKLPLTTEELVQKIPLQVRKMLWAINNSRSFIQTQQDTIQDLYMVNKKLRVDLISKEAEISVLKLENKAIKSRDKKILENLTI